MSALFDDLEYAVKLTQVEQFVVPPTSMFDAAQGYWTERKQAWLAEYPQLRAPDARVDLGAGGFGHLAASADDTSRKMAAVGDGATVFDPVLCEVAYSWWTRIGSVVFDPFAGGPVRGIVAAAMGRTYLGVDVRQEQVDHNTDVGIAGSGWKCGDAATFSPPESDFVFSCPPYGSLEQYGGGPRDLSSMPFDNFRAAYKTAVTRSVASLRPDRFATFVVGNYKERGVLRDLAGLTVEAFGEAGADYYGDIIYTPPAGSAALRAQSSFPKNRRPMPRHQYVLVFVKGDPKAASRYVNGETL